jgi:hypothetical protein
VPRAPAKVDGRERQPDQQDRGQSHVTDRGLQGRLRDSVHGKAEDSRATAREAGGARQRERDPRVRQAALVVVLRRVEVARPAKGHEHAPLKYEGAGRRLGGPQHLRLTTRRPPARGTEGAQTNKRGTSRGIMMERCCVLFQPPRPCAPRTSPSMPPVPSHATPPCAFCAI